MKFIIITGPTGSGKSTIGKALAKSYSKCVHIDADLVKHMVVSGFERNTSTSTSEDWLFKEWETVGEAITSLIASFRKNNFDVVLAGFIDEEAWSQIFKEFKADSKFLLLPDIEENKRRNLQRPEHWRMQNKDVQRHQNHFKTSRIYDEFMTIDSTTHTVEQTVEEIKKLINNTKKD